MQASLLSRYFFTVVLHTNEHSLNPLIIQSIVHKGFIIAINLFVLIMGRRNYKSGTNGPFVVIIALVTALNITM
jgi:hypothetical protein